MNKSDILIVIPARGGSKRLPRKNVKPLAGKPLICWTIEAALKAKLDAKIIVTSDDDEILELADAYKDKGVFRHKRPSELATDKASTVNVLVDVLESEKLHGNSPTTVVLLQPTSPLREEVDVIKAVRLFKEKGEKSTVVGVCELDHPTAWVGTINGDKELLGVNLNNRRSQDYTREYRLNGAIYVVSVDFINSEKSLFTNELFALEMPRLRSIDIDEELDFKFCETIIDKKFRAIDEGDN